MFISQAVNALSCHLVYGTLNSSAGGYCYKPLRHTKQIPMFNYKYFSQFGTWAVSYNIDRLRLPLTVIIPCSNKGEQPRTVKMNYAIDFCPELQSISIFTATEPSLAFENMIDWISSTETRGWEDMLEVLFRRQHFIYRLCSICRVCVDNCKYSFNSFFCKRMAII